MALFVYDSPNFKACLSWKPGDVSTAQDFRELLQEVGSLANGITFCSGSLGVSAENDLPVIIREFGNRIHFVSLRNVQLE